MSNIEEAQQIKVPLSGIVYGNIIYWVTLVGAVIVIVGSVLSFLTEANYMLPGYLLSAIWEGKTVDQIWAVVGGPPEGHWYLWEIATGNGLTMFGIALGVFSVIPGLLAAGVVLWREKNYLYGSLAVIAALITIAAMAP
jgi:hypothetical protein